MGPLTHCFALGKCSPSGGSCSGVIVISVCRHQNYKNVIVSYAGSLNWNGLGRKLKKLCLELRLQTWQEDRFLNGKIRNVDLCIQPRVMRYHGQTWLVTVPREGNLKLRGRIPGMLCYRQNKNRAKCPDWESFLGSKFYIKHWWARNLAYHLFGLVLNLSSVFIWNISRSSWQIS